MYTFWLQLRTCLGNSRTSYLLDLIGTICAAMVSLPSQIAPPEWLESAAASGKLFTTSHVFAYAYLITDLPYQTCHEENGFHDPSTKQHQAVGGFCGT